MDNTDLRDLLEYTHSQLNTIRKAVATSGHARTMFSIDCLVGAAAEQTRCKLAGLDRGDMPIGRSVDVTDDGMAGPGKAAAPARARRSP